MTVLLIRNSSRSLYKRCQRAYWWAYVDGLMPRRQADALAFGTWVHDALAAWYKHPGLKRGPHPVETFLQVCEESARSFVLDDESESRLVSLRDLGVAMLEGYVQRWGEDAGLSVIQPERNISFRIPYPSRVNLLPAYARQVGTVDLVARDLGTGYIWLWEHKTAKTISTAHLSLDEQPGTYLSTAERSLKKQGLLAPNERIHGIMYNFLRKAIMDDRPRDSEGYALNKDGSRSKVQPRPFYERHPIHRTKAARRRFLERLQEDALKMQRTTQMVRKHGESVLMKTPHVNCSRFCAFFEMCELEERGGNWQSYRDAMFTHGDPFAAHATTDTQPTFDFG